MKLTTLLNRLKSQAGFTMIELLVVISVIGVLAVAVLSAINPIEQINKGRDTRTRSDAAELINASERYYAIQEIYPWNRTYGSWVAASTDPSTVFSSPDGAGGDFSWAEILADSSEVKDSFFNRVNQEQHLYIYKPTGTNSTMYSCFRPLSRAFQQQALDSCTSQLVPNGMFGTFCAGGTAAVNASNYICLP